VKASITDTVGDVNRRLIGWMLVGVQIVMFVVLATLPWRSPTAASVAVAVPFVIVGGWLGATSFATLGSALTPTPVPIAGAGLRTSGPYSRIRHPIYTSVILLTLAVVILAGTWRSWLWVFFIVVFFWLKSRWEDRLLAQEYGDPWVRWAQQTGALIPRRRTRAP
jgi:protein-S-isoprenylcysteine O-methyltransferase Ste14